MELVFATGGALRRIVIKGRKISLIAVELGYKPLVIDLDKLNSKQNKKKMKALKLTESEIKSIHELRELNNENEIAKDIIKDYQKEGWRLVKKYE